MYISKRSSGGRGEYEVAGTFRSLSAASLVDKPISLVYGGGESRVTGVTLRLGSGKHRLRASPHMHLHRQVEVILLMPKSIREEARVEGGQPIIRRAAYVVSRMDMRDVAVDANHAAITLGKITVSNSSGSEDLDFRPRLERVRTLHARKNELPKSIGDLLARHETIVDDLSFPVPVAGEKIINELLAAVHDWASEFDFIYPLGTDPLDAIESMLPEGAKDVVEIEEVGPEESEVRRRDVEGWRRWVRTRGGPSAEFRRAVRSAYKSTCVICGVTLPQTMFSRTPGVDAAHILPWAVFDLDVVSNGLCLCRTHHWAFDQGILGIVYDSKRTSYSVSVSDQARLAFAHYRATLKLFEGVAGTIPNSRLPRVPAHRPNPDFLVKLYSATGVTFDSP